MYHVSIPHVQSFRCFQSLSCAFSMLHVVLVIIYIIFPCRIGMFTTAYTNSSICLCYMRFVTITIWNLKFDFVFCTGNHVYDCSIWSKAHPDVVRMDDFSYCKTRNEEVYVTGTSSISLDHCRPFKDCFYAS